MKEPCTLAVSAARSNSIRSEEDDGVHRAKHRVENALQSDGPFELIAVAENEGAVHAGGERREIELHRRCFVSGARVPEHCNPVGDADDEAERIKAACTRIRAQQPK